MKLEEYIDFLVRWLVAFFIPLGWAIILYPLMRKFQKSWHTLLITVSVLSFAVFVLKEIIGSHIFDELVTYGLGIFGGVAGVFLLFNSKSRWLKALPKDDTFFRNHEIRKEVHLRHLFQVATLIEDEGRDFYDKLAERVNDVNVKNLCRKLANDEIEHKQLFQATLSRWLSLPINKEFLVSLTQELKARGVFLGLPPPNVTEENMVKYAIEQEEKTADFYLSFEKTFPDAWKRMHLQNLVMQEKTHASELRSAYRFFKDTK